MNEFNINRLTANSLIKNEFLELIPEIYSLKNTIENNYWHNEHNLFDHTIRVLGNLNEILLLKPFNKAKKKIINDKLCKKIGLYSRKDLLRITTIIHDIGKPICLIENPDGTTRCPAHEIVGAFLVPNFSKRLLLNDREENHIKQLIEYHSLIIDIQNQVINKRKKKRHFLSIYKNIVGDLLLELLLLHYADLLASDLKKNDVIEFNQRKKLTLEYIESIY